MEHFIAMFKSIIVKRMFLLCAIGFVGLYCSAQSTVYLVSSYTQTAPSMTVYINNGVDGKIEMTSPFHKKLYGVLDVYKKMIRKCTLKEEGKVILSYDGEFGSGKKFHQEITLNLKPNETYYVEVWGKKWKMKEITKKQYDKLIKKIEDFHICPDWNSDNE